MAVAAVAAATAVAAAVMAFAGPCKQWALLVYKERWLEFDGAVLTIANAKGDPPNFTLPLSKTKVRRGAALSLRPAPLCFT